VERVVSRQKQNLTVYAALCNECISETNLAALSYDFRSQYSRSLPIARFDFHHGHSRQCFRYRGREVGIAQQFGKDDRNHHDLPIFQNSVQ